MQEPVGSEGGKSEIQPISTDSVGNCISPQSTSPVQRPFELPADELEERLDEMVSITISDLTSEFLLLPTGDSFLRYPDFQTAYEILKRHTSAFEDFTEENAIRAALEDSRVFGVLRAMLGMSPPEWAELTNSEFGSDVSTSAARNIDKDCRDDAAYISKLEERQQKWHAAAQKKNETARPILTLSRIKTLIRAAVKFIGEGAPDEVDGVVHRLAKFDTEYGLESLQYVAKEHVPYAVLLYERYIGRPFATHRDAVSELVGEVMENAVEKLLRDAGVSYRKTKRAESVPGVEQAPDFFIPDEKNPKVIIEAKITSDDGTARDKVARIKVLVNQRREHAEKRKMEYEVIACIDGRGFRQRREDMRQLLTKLDGKVFTTASLEQLLTHSAVQKFVTKAASAQTP